ncbi:DUF3137 domain-containing protein [Candidatus Saccharibacteria bacterium]|nr:DUF3137 domain-containing protein [Candidatus Saccharibacteria bacterium]
MPTATASSASRAVTFEDIKKLQEQYRVKSQQTSKKRKRAVLITCAILFPIEAIIFGSGLTKLPSFDVTHFLILLMPTLFASAFQALMVSLVVFLATYKETVVLNGYRSTYKRLYKAYFIHRQLAKLFTDLYYHHDQGLSRQLLKETGLIYTGDIFKSNDLVVAKYKNTNFMQADVEVIDKEERRDKDGHKEVYYVTVFKGRYLIFEFPKKFTFKMVISYHGQGRDYVNPKTQRGFQKIETESPDFNKRFLVYAEDGFEAFYILNPDFIHQLEQLGAKYNNALSLYFSDHKMYVGLNDGNDAFEPPNPATPIDEETETAKVVDDMRLITNLVDSLKLSK